MNDFISSWLADIEAFCKELSKKGGVIDHVDCKIASPLKTARLEKLEASLLRPMPKVIENILLNGTSKVA